MDAEQIAACSFNAWYPRFRDVTFRSAVLPLPPGLADFLVQDGVFLPSTSAAVRVCYSCGSASAHPLRHASWLLQHLSRVQTCLLEQRSTIRLFCMMSVRTHSLLTVCFLAGSCRVGQSRTNSL